MLFKQELIYKIVAGEKRQTRRPVKPEEKLIPANSYWSDKLGRMVQEHDDHVALKSKRIKWEVGKDYAVQPKRGAAGMVYGLLPMLTPIPAGKCNDDPIRIRITAIRREDVRQISAEDARTEGFEDVFGFLAVWMGFYDKLALKTIQSVSNVAWHGGKPNGQESVDMVFSYLNSRPAHLYDAWALSFHLDSEAHE